MEVDNVFREFERRVFDFRNARMPLEFWTLNSRLLWLAGMNDRGIETYREAKARSKAASLKLAHAATEHKKVVLVAHGFLNRQLVIELKSDGWQVIRQAGSGYLGATLLVRARG